MLNPVYSKAPTDAPLLFSQYEYSIGFWPEQYVAKVGNLVSYTGSLIYPDFSTIKPDLRAVHDFGGHWAGLDNPPALIGDLRAMAPYFSA